MRPALVTKMHEGRTCALCAGEGIVSHGCTRYVCHICKGRGFVVEVPPRIPVQRFERDRRGVLARVLMYLACLLVLIPGCGFAGGLAVGAVVAAPPTWALGVWSAGKLRGKPAEAPPVPKPEPPEWRDLDAADAAVGKVVGS